MAGFGSHPGFGGGNSFAPFLAQFAKSMIEKRKQDADDAYRASQVALQQAAQATSAGHLDVRRKEIDAQAQERQAAREELAVKEKEAEAELEATTAYWAQQKNISPAEARIYARMKVNPATIAQQEEANADRDKSRDISAEHLSLAREGRADEEADEQIVEDANVLIGRHGSPEAALQSLAGAPDKPEINRVRAKIQEKLKKEGVGDVLAKIMAEAFARSREGVNPSLAEK